MKTYSHEHEAKITHCVRTHKRFSLFLASKSCFFDINQNTCFLSIQTCSHTTAACRKLHRQHMNLTDHTVTGPYADQAAADCTKAKKTAAGYDKSRARPHMHTHAGRAHISPKRDKGIILQRHQRRVNTMPSTIKLSLIPPEALTATGDLTVIWRVEGL